MLQSPLMDRHIEVIWSMMFGLLQEQYWSTDLSIVFHESENYDNGVNLVWPTSFRKYAGYPKTLSHFFMIHA